MRAIPIVTLVVALDFAYQWYKTREQMMMTFQEVKDEMKQSRRGPHFQRDETPKAKRNRTCEPFKRCQRLDVVVANPTHFAVAICHRKAEADAPVVMPKGGSPCVEDS